MTDTPRPKATADSAALPVMGLGDKLDDKPVKRSKVVAWAFWDWGLQPFHTVLLTFIFTPLYLTTDFFLAPEQQALPRVVQPGTPRSPSSPAGSASARPSPAC